MENVINNNENVINNNENGKVKKVVKNMENLKNVENGNTKEALRVVKLNGLDKFDSLIDESIDSNVLTKSFIDMTEDDIMKLKLCRAKVKNKPYTDRNGKLVDRFIARVEIVKGLVILNKTLDDNELRIIQLNQADLIEPKEDIYVPVKLFAFKTKDNRYAYKYLACLTNGVYIGSGTDRNGKSNGFFNSKELTLLVSHNMSSDDKVKFGLISNESAKSLEIDVFNDPFDN